MSQRAPSHRFVLPTRAALASAFLLAVLAPSSHAGPQEAARARGGEAAVPDAWLARVTEDLARAEYAFAGLEPGLFSAPNRSQELRSRIGTKGIEVFPRATDAGGEGAAWKLELATVGVGRTGDVWTLECLAVSADGARVELDHGRLVEWFVNDERGIEQGWTIEQRPAGIDELEILLAITGDLSLRLDEGGRSGVFVDARGEARLRYTGLHAEDATGRALEARLMPTPEGVVVRIEDTNAVYPLLVDPLLTSPAWTAESNQAGAEFGNFVSTAGDVNGDGHSDVIVGAPYYDNGEADEGAAFVYHGSKSGLAANPAWTAESNQVGARFGARVSTAGDVNGDGYSDVIVGAPYYNNGQSDEGRAYVYHGSASGLATNPAWSVESNHATAWLGLSVATAGDVNGDGYSDVIVGAPLYDNGQINEGTAFVYNGSQSGLATSPAWTAESNQANAWFGISVSTAGDVNGDGYSDVIVGADLYDGGEIDEGRAVVYHGSAGGLADSPAWIVGPSQPSAYFGSSVSTAGDVNGDGYSDVIVGAIAYNNGESNEGRAFVYHGSAVGLAESPAWTAESNQVAALFGHSVSTAGDVNGDGFSDVIVGAHFYDNGENEEGRAYVYHGSKSGLADSPAWTAEANQTFAQFGVRVSTAGDVNGDGYSDVIVGARTFDNGENDEGRAYVYHGSAGGLAADPTWSGEANQAGAGFGVSVSTAGDVNGDGYSDVIVGAPYFDNGQLVEGAAFVYHGSATGLGASPAWTAESNQVLASFGYSVSTAGDVNGDGYSDVVVGAWGYDNGQTDEGRAFVYHGSVGGLTPIPAWTAESNQAAAYFGISVSTAGDVNGDGTSDVVVGAIYYDNGEADEGAAFVYHGSAGGLAASPAWMGESNQAGALYGTSVSTAGDVDGDGYSDVIVGADSYDNGQIDEGRAFVYHGSAGGLAASPAWTAESNQLSAFFGTSVSTAGDVNGDGYSDVIVGAERYTNGQSYEGRAFVYHGEAGGLTTNPAWTAESNRYGNYFGFSVSTAGDVNGDGYSDVIVGARYYSNGEVDEGQALVYHGSAGGLAASPAWTAESNQAYAYLGTSVSTAGDVNGDGYSDVIVGANEYANGQHFEGAAFVYLGNGGDGGLVLGLQQRTRSGAHPIALLGSTTPVGLFRLRASFPMNLVRFAWASSATPMAWLEWEPKPLGRPFDGTGIERGTPQSLVPSGGNLTLDELVESAPRSGRAGYAGEAVFHWRARVATNNPLFPHTAWFSLPGNNVTETKLRKPARELR